MNARTTSGSTAEFTVQGMTCEHCVASVTEEVQEIAGVTDVQVELVTGNLTIVSDQPLSEAAVREAVAEAGYQIA